MPSASDPRQPIRTRQPVPRPAQPGQRPAQPTRAQLSLPRARCSPPLVWLNLLSGRFDSPLLVRPSLQAVPALSSRHLPSRAQAPQSHSHHARGSHGVAPATRSSYNTHARRGAQKKSSPVPMIIGVVAAVLALVADRFLCRAGRQGLLCR